MLISLMLTFFGIYQWFVFYKATRGHYPKFYKKWKDLNGKMLKNPFAGFGFMFSHILEFWTLSIVFWMGLILMMFVAFGRSNAFEAAKEFCESDPNITEQTGEIIYYGLLFGGTISTQGETGQSDLTFTIVAENGNYNANAQLVMDNGNWEVTNLKLK